MAKGLLLLVLSLLLLQLAASTDNDYFPCRFASFFSQQDFLSNKKDQIQAFMRNVSYWEGKFHADGVGVNSKSGLTYDGHQIDFQTGKVHDPLHAFSASSKESLHVNLLTLALNGEENARLFFASSFGGFANLDAQLLQLLEIKITSYEKFNTEYPGFGGFLPWFSVTDAGISILHDWPDKTPSLDNGQLLWAMIAAAHVLDQKGQSNLATRYRNFFNMAMANIVTIFYEGNGVVRGVAKIRDIKAAPTRSNYYMDGFYNLDDPYEGELFTFLMDFFGNWEGYSTNEKEKMWGHKRKKLVSVEYQTPQGPITVERGFWHSSHEKWKYLVLPYNEVPINHRLFMNGEKARTWHSAINKLPGLFASVTNVVKDGNYNPGYTSDCGIQSIASEKVRCTTTVTPYGAFPVILANATVGLAWYHNMIKGPRMQNIYGSTESVNITGNAICPVITWDSKITTIVAMSGGIASITSEYLQTKPELYQRFVDIITIEWGRVFTEIKGENLPFLFPTASIPDVAPSEFSSCEITSNRL